MSAPQKTLMVMAGGTGGHIYPGIAVAQVLQKEGWRIVWMGNPNGMEARRIPGLGYEMAWVDFSAVRGKGLLRKLFLPLSLLKAFVQAWMQVRRFQPHVVLGMGGYVSFPGGMMSVLAGRPLVLHEQNAVAGQANRVLAKVADAVLSGFPEVLPSAQWVGNPVRDEIAHLPSPEERFGARSGVLKVLVVGGSLGASVLNTLVPQALAMIPADVRPQVVHQAGEKQFEALSQAYAQAGVEAELLAFIDDMAARYAWADVVICRAGALTIAELAVAGVGSVLVPFPYAVDDHQTKNAEFLTQAGAAVLMPQDHLSAKQLAQWLQETSREQLLKMALAAYGCAKAEAAYSVAKVCSQWADRALARSGRQSKEERNARET